MPVSSTYLAYVLDQLRVIEQVHARRMFGGIGLYSGDVFFALIDDDVVYFKADDSNRSDYTSRGCEPFRPLADDPVTVSISYYRVPDDVLESTDDLKTWARKSVAVATAIAAAKALKKAAKTSRVARKKQS